jgi:hypothetical protein
LFLQHTTDNYRPLTPQQLAAPVPSRIRLVRCAAAAMKISGELMISLPAE